MGLILGIGMASSLSANAATMTFAPNIPARAPLVANSISTLAVGTTTQPWTMGYYVATTTTPSLFTGGFLAPSSSTISALTVGNSTTTNATTTTLSTTNASTTNLVVSSAGASSGSNCLQINAAGAVSNTGSACSAGGGGAGFGNTWQLISNLTAITPTTTVGIQVISSSTITALTTLTSTSTNATTTNIAVTGTASSSDSYMSGLTTNGVHYSNAQGHVLSTAQGAANSILTANAGVPSFSSTPTIGGLITASGGILSVSSSTLFNLTMLTSTTTNATTTNLAVSGTASTSALRVNGNAIPAFFYPRFGYATSSAWTGTTTNINGNPLALGAPVSAETWVSATCNTDQGTVDAQFYNGLPSNATKLDMIAVTNTPTTVSFTTNNVFSALASTSVVFGTPAGTPGSVACTIQKFY